MLVRSVFIFSFWLCLLSCQSKHEISIIFGGDVMLDRGIRAKINTRGINYLFNDLKTEFRNSDFAIVNLECPATDIKAPVTKKYSFRAEPKLLPELRAAGITHCILANNHSYDHGRKGLVSTADNLRKADITPIGFGSNQESACAPIVIEKNGIRVAIFSSVTLLLESWMYLQDAPGMCQATIDDLTKAISNYKATHAGDHIIVTLHWGVEYQTAPTSVQRDEAKALIDAGADAIIGHHPHVVQKYEKLGGKPVFYSVGNLIFDNSNPATLNGVLIKLLIKPTGVSSEIIPYTAEDFKPIIQQGERVLF